MSFSGYLTYLLKDMLRSMLKPGLITRDKRSVPAGQEQCGCQKNPFHQNPVLLNRDTTRLL